MEENFKSKVGFVVFILFVLFLAIGGYFFTKYILNEKKEVKKDNNISYKIDNNKDYIYYENESTLSEEGKLYYKDVVINIKGFEDLTNNLRRENQGYKDNIKYISDQDLISNEIPNFNYDNLYALNYRTYENYEYGKFVSLVIIDSQYSCFDLLSFTKSKSYIFDIKEGKMLSEDEILTEYNLTFDNVKDALRNYLNENQEIVDEVPLIKIDETVNELNNYSFYINEYGHLCLHFLVKTTQNDYNGNMEVK